MRTSVTCSNCNAGAKSRRRDFSPQAWSVLLLWDEVKKTAIDEPICDSCYRDLREVLIERADEIERALSGETGKVAAKRKGKKLAS